MRREVAGRDTLGLCSAFQGGPCKQGGDEPGDAKDEYQRKDESWDLNGKDLNSRGRSTRS
jgi:hypothetical protein